MRSVIPAVIACLLLALPAADRASAETAPQGAPAPAAPARAAAPAGGSTDSEAVARHAKRTACLKSAKDKKLVGAQKNAFIKDCIGAP